MTYSHDMQDAYNHRHRQEVRIRLHEHSLYLVDLALACAALLLRSFAKALIQASVHVEFEVRHRLEDDLQRQLRRRLVHDDVLRS